MSDDKARPQVIALGREDVEDAADVLTAAFATYPMTDYFLADSGARKAIHLHGLMRLSCLCREPMGWPLLGGMLDGRLVGVACVTGPGHPPEVPEVEAAANELFAQFSEQAAERIGRYMEIKEAHLPDGPHYYVAVVGVHPDGRGRGVGTAVMRRVSEIVDADPDVIGVGLDTQSARNVELYERLGYRVMAETHVGPVPTWCMFRPRAT